METIKQRLINYYGPNTNEIITVIQQIISNPDPFVLEFYNYIWQRDTVFLVLADIFSSGYLAIRSVFLHSSLLDEPYTNRKANAHLLIGEDINLLGSMTIMIEMNNEILRFISQYYPNKVSKLSEIMDRILNVDVIDPIDKTPGENFKKIQDTVLENFNYIVDWLLR